MDLPTLLGKGYFAPELPPPFNTENFGTKSGKILNRWNTVYAGLSGADKQKFKESVATRFSVKRYGFLRRLISIPNPCHQLQLSDAIVANWAVLDGVLNRSTFSSSRPIENPPTGRAVDRKLDIGEFIDQCIVSSFRYRYELVTDLSRFYPTLYTHAIPWAIHGKALAKAQMNNPALLGNILDKAVRAGNSRQTFGIPIGPDTSLIIAELILCTIDEEISNTLTRTDCVVERYMDDFKIGCKTRGDAEEILRRLQTIFGGYELQANEEKTLVAELPCPIVEDWAIDLRRFDLSIKKTLPRNLQIKNQRRALTGFASSVLKHAQAHPDKWVPKFAIRFVMDIGLFDENWDIYSSLLFKMTLVELGLLPTVGRILVSNRRRVRKNKLRAFLRQILYECVPLSHHFETAWALWLCKEFRLKIPDDLARQILESSDVISTLVLLDLRAAGLVNTSISLAQLESQLTVDSLMDETWLLTYEAMNKGWVKVPKKLPANQNEFFRILRRHKISFYDEARGIQPMSLKAPGGQPIPVAGIPPYGG